MGTQSAAASTSADRFSSCANSTPELRWLVMMRREPVIARLVDGIQKLAITAAVATAAFSPLASAQLPVAIPAGDDGWTTAIGGAVADFASPCPSLAPDFFAAGSPVFDGRIVFQGAPLSTLPAGALGNTDTIIRRTGGTMPLDVQGVGPNFADTVPVEMVALHLISVAPITVAGYGDWDVEAFLSATTSQTVSALTITRQCPDGGNYAGTIAVTARLVFTHTTGAFPPVTLDPAPLQTFASSCSWAIPSGPGGFEPASHLLDDLPAGVSVDGDGDGSFESLTIGNSTTFRAGVEACGAAAFSTRICSEAAACDTRELRPALKTTVTKLLGEGDSVPISASAVISVQNCDVNNSGDWLVEFGAGLVNDNAVMHNGTVIYQEGTNTGFPASHTVMGGNNWIAGPSSDAVDINDNGDILVFIRSCVDVNGVLLPRGMALWKSGTSGQTYVLIEEGLTPSDTMTGEPAGFDEPVGARWDFVSEVWQNNNNQIWMQALSTSGNDFFVMLEHDGAGTILSQAAFAIGGTFHNPDMGGNGTHAEANSGAFSSSKPYSALNNNGDILFPVDDFQTQPGGADVDSHIYLNTNEAIWEADLSATGSGFPYAQMSDWEVDLNDDGEAIFAGRDDSPAASDTFIIRSDSLGVFTPFIREGDLLPNYDAGLGYTILGTGFGNVSLSSSGDVTWICDTSLGQGPNDIVLYRNQSAVLIERVTPIPGTDGITDIGRGFDEMAVSDNGRFIVVELDIEPLGGNPSTTANDLEGIYRLDLGFTPDVVFPSSCNGDGGNQTGCTNCPCVNNSAVATVGGCLNSAGTSARLIPSGEASVTADTLRFIASGLPPNSFSVLNSGDSLAPTNMVNPCFGMNSGAQSLVFDGLRCAISNTRRHGGRAADASGDVGTTNNGFGPPNGPLIGFAAQSGWIAGQTRHFQLINRDNVLLVCQRGLNTSQAVSVTYAP